VTPHGVDTKETTTFGHASTRGDAWGIHQLLRQAVEADVGDCSRGGRAGGTPGCDHDDAKTSEVDRPSVKPPSMRWPSDRRASAFGVVAGMQVAGCTPSHWSVNHAVWQADGGQVRLAMRFVAEQAATRTQRVAVAIGRVVPCPHWLR